MRLNRWKALNNERQYLSEVSCNEVIFEHPDEGKGTGCNTPHTPDKILK
jgi:hypothetical protein